MVMVHYREIARALRLVCQSAAALSEDTDGTTMVHVGSNCQFASGDAVRLVGSDGTSEQHVIAQTIGLTQVQLDEAVTADFTVDSQARLELCDGIGPEVKWIALGCPEGLPEPISAQLPAIMIEPGALKQPNDTGSNRTYLQEYSFNVYYVDRKEDGVEAEMDAIDEASGLFAAIMADPYLGGTCYHSQVMEFDPSPAAEEALRDRAIPLKLVRLEVLARRAELVA
jgi:hypothetical protein